MKVSIYHGDVVQLLLLLKLISARSASAGTSALELAFRGRGSLNARFDIGYATTTTGRINILYIYSWGNPAVMKA